MALTISTNVASLNSQRSLKTVQESLNRSMRRLSSGLRINSAKDDAAGLAITDRMTSQIRGRNQAIRNSRDGISLTQTAEGALQEVTNILQRMRELAVQSANATNTNSDRISLQSEVDQLKQELNRITENTSFNGMNLLDGTMTSRHFQVGSNANQSIGFSISSAKASDLGINSLTSNNESGLGAVAGGSGSTISVDNTGVDTYTVTKSDLSTGTVAAGATAAQMALNLQAETGGTVTGTYSNSIIFDFAVGNVRVDDATLHTGTINIGNDTIEYTINADNSFGGGVLTSNGDGGSISVDFAAETITYSKATNDGTTLDIGATVGHNNLRGNLHIYDADGVDTGAFFDSHQNFSNINFNQRASATYEIDGGDVISITSNGDSLGVSAGQNGLTTSGAATDTSGGNNVGEQTLTIRSAGGNTEVDISADDSAQEIAEKINASSEQSSVTASAETAATFSNLSANGNVSFNLTGANTDSIFISASVTSQDLTNLAIAINSQEAETGIVATLSADKTSITLDQTSGADIKIGDFEHSAAITDTGTPSNAVEVTFDITGSTGTAGSLKDGGSTNEEADQSDSTVVGGQVSFSSSESFTVSSSIDNSAGSLFNVTASKANSSSLKSIEMVNVITVDGASSALEYIDGSLSQIATMRGDLGAIQNRLESTIANLQNVSENLTAARSRVLDADVSIETSNMTKQNILQQAGVSVLSQANQVPQLALSLLN